VSSVTGAVDVKVGALADQTAQVNAGTVATQVTPSVQVIKQLFTQHFYQRLPHPLRHLLKELPAVDGTDVELYVIFCLRYLRYATWGK